MLKGGNGISNGSYLFRLNEELSGQAELGPYSISSDIENGQEGTVQAIHGDEADTLQDDQGQSEQ